MLPKREEDLSEQAKQERQSLTAESNNEQEKQPLAAKSNNEQEKLPLAAKSNNEQEKLPLTAESTYEQEKISEQAKIDYIENLKIEIKPINIDYINIGGTRDTRYAYSANNKVGVTGTTLGQPAIYRTIDRLEHVGSPININVINLMAKDSSMVNNDDINLICKTITDSSSDKVIINGGLDHAIRIMTEIYKNLSSIKKTIVYGGSNGSFYSNRKAVFVDTGVEIAAVQLYPHGSFLIAVNLSVFDIKDVQRNTFNAVEHADVIRSVFSKKNCITDATGKLLLIPKFTAVDFGGTFGKILEHSANSQDQDYVYPNVGSLDSLFNDVLVKFGAAISMTDRVIIGERIDSMLSDEKYRQEILKILKAIETKHQIITHGTDSMANTMFEVYQRGEMGKNYIFTGSCTPISEEETTDGYHSVGAAFAILSYLEAISNGDIKKRAESNVWLAISGLPIPYNEDIIKDNQGRFIKVTQEQHHEYLELNKKHLYFYQKNRSK